MKSILLAWISIVVVFLIIDAIWLGLVATSFYRRHLGALMLGPAEAAYRSNFLSALCRRDPDPRLAARRPCRVTEPGADAWRRSRFGRLRHL